MCLCTGRMQLVDDDGKLLSDVYDPVVSGCLVCCFQETMIRIQDCGRMCFLETFV